MTTSGKANQRKSTRVRRKMHAFLKPKGRVNAEVILRDISLTGAFLITKDILTVTTKLLLYVQLPAAGKEMLCILPAVIVRVERRPGVPVLGYGIHFETKEMSWDTSRQLMLYVQENEGAQGLSEGNRDE